MHRLTRFLLALLCLSLAACLPQPPEPLRIATNEWPGYEPLYLARSLGYLDKTPIRLYELPSASEVSRAFRNGAVDAAALTLDEALQLLADGIDIRVLLVMDVSNGADAVIAKPHIRALSQLKGKRIGVESQATGAYMLSRTLEAARLHPGDVRIVPMPVDRHDYHFRQGHVDAVVTFEPVRSRLLARGGRLLYDSSRIPNEIFDVLVVRGEIFRNRPKDMQALRYQWFRAMDYLRDNPDDAAKRMARRLGISGRDFLMQLRGLKLPDRQENERLLDDAQPGMLSPARQLASVMLREKLLEKPVDPARLLGQAATEQAP